MAKTYSLRQRGLNEPKFFEAERPSNFKLLIKISDDGGILLVEECGI